MRCCIKAVPAARSALLASASAQRARNGRSAWVGCKRRLRRGRSARVWVKAWVWAKARWRKRCASRLLAITVAGCQDVPPQLAQTVVPQPIARGLRRLRMVARHAALRSVREAEAKARISCAATLLRRESQPIVELAAPATPEHVWRKLLAEARREGDLKDALERARLYVDAHLQALQPLRRRAEAL